MSLIVGKTALNALRPMLVADDGSIDVNVHGGAVGSGDMKARSDIADPATSTFIKCNPDGTLEMTAELDSSTLAKEVTLASIDNKITKGSQDTLPYAQQVGSYVKNESTNLWQPLSAHHSNKSLKVIDANITNGNQISKIMGIDSVGTQQQIKVSTAGRIELDAYNLSSLSTANNQTNGNQLAKCMGNFGGTQVQIKVGDTGRLIVEVDGIRSSGSQIGWTIANGATGYSNAILMETHTRIAFEYPVAPFAIVQPI